MKSWSFASPPRAGEETACTALPDHRLAYLDYEGPISGGRGNVVRWDRGRYEVLACDDVLWELKLAGEKLRGEATFRRCGRSATEWRFMLAAEIAAT